MRPLFTVENNRLKMSPNDIKGDFTFEDLKSNGLIEYLDVE